MAVQLFFRHFAGVAFDSHFAPAVALSFGHGDFHRLVFLVGRHLYIGIDNAEIEIAVVLIKIGNALHVLREFVGIEAVAFGQPGKQAAFAQGHLAAQAAVGIALVAFKFDVFDGGGFALVDFQLHRHAVARQTGNCGGDFHRIFALFLILILQTGHGFVQTALVERFGLPQAEGVEVFLDGVVLNQFAAADFETADHRAFDHGQQQLVAHAFHAHVVKQSGGIEAADNLLALPVAEGVAHFDR